MTNRLMLAALLALIAAAPVAQAALPELHSDDQIIKLTDRVIALNKLSPRIGCLQYSANRGERNRVYVKVMELHDKTCGGDPQTEPLLFTIRYDLRAGRAATDKGSLSGAFHPIRAPGG